MDSIHSHNNFFSSDPLNPIFSPFNQYYDCSKRKYRRDSNGYEKNRFIQQPPRHFLCGLCINVVKKPLECTKCGQLYCEPCTKILKKNSEKKTFECLICKNAKDPRNPSMVLRKMIGELQIFCCFVHKGCLESVSLDLLQKHESCCPYKEVMCENHPYCKNTGVLKEFLEIEVMFQGISVALANQANIRQKSYVCSDSCRLVLGFHRKIMNKQTQKALLEYSELLKSSEKFKEELE